MLKILTVTAATLAMLSAAAAADLPRKEPPPPAAPVGKAPIGKYPVGKAPIGKYPQPVAAGAECCEYRRPKGHRSVLFGRLFRKRIRVTPVLRRAVTSTARQAGLANPPDRWRGLSAPDVTWLFIRPERSTGLHPGR